MKQNSFTARLWELGEHNAGGMNEQLQYRIGPFMNEFGDGFVANVNMLDSDALSLMSSESSGKKKAHKHKSFLAGDPSGDRGVSRSGGQGSKFMCYPRNPRNINLFIRMPDREDR